MKRLITVFLFLLCLTGCDLLQDNYDDISLIGKANRISFSDSYQEIEHLLSDEVLELIEGMNITMIKVVNESLIITYYDESYRLQTLLKLDANNYVDWRIDGYKFKVIEGNGEQYFIEYCDVQLICKFTVYQEDGSDIITTGTLHEFNLFNQRQLQNYVIEDGDNVFFGLEQTSHWMYELKKYTEEDTESIHSIETENFISAHQLNDGSYLFVYRKYVSEKRYVFEHVSKEGEILSSYDSLDIPEIFLLRNGYVVYKEGFYEYKTFDDEVVWGNVQIGERITYMYESGGTLFAFGSQKQYAISPEGIVGVMVIPYSYNLGSKLVIYEDDNSNNYYLRELRDEEDLVVGIELYDKENDEVLWAIHYELVMKVLAIDNVIYVDHYVESQRTMSIIDVSGKLINTFDFKGELVDVTSDGNMILAKNNILRTIITYGEDLDTDLAVEDTNEEIDYNGFAEVTIDGEVVWDHEINGMIKSVNKEYDHYFVTYEKYLSFGDDLLYPIGVPTYNLIVDTDGNIVFDTYDVYENSKIISIHDNVFYIRVNGEVDSVYTDSMLQIDYSGDILKEYSYIGLFNESHFAILENELLELDKLTLEYYNVRMLN